LAEDLLLCVVVAGLMDESSEKMEGEKEIFRSAGMYVFCAWDRQFRGIENFCLATFVVDM
jgi:hypothetical protein